MAEAVFTHMVAINGLENKFHNISSAGTAGYHVDQLPDPRTVSTCKKRGVTVDHLAQQLEPEDFGRYDYILAMDSSNLRDIRGCQRAGTRALVKLFGEFGDGDDISDPYYGSIYDFDENFRQCTEYSTGLLKYLGFIPTKSIA